MERLLKESSLKTQTWKPHKTSAIVTKPDGLRQEGTGSIFLAMLVV
jgi:hypothetical protein